MQLFLLRHGEAHDQSLKYRTDAQRPLTATGIEEVEAVARGMKRLKLSFDIILTSPLTRAIETSGITAEVLQAKKPLQTESLVVEADPRLIVREINQHYGAAENILLVGHEPHLTSLLSLLLTGGNSLSIRLKKAGSARLTVPELRCEQCARLDWLLTPGQLSKMG